MKTWLEKLFFGLSGGQIIKSAVGVDSPKELASPEEHALIVETSGPSITMDDVYGVEDALEAAFAKTGVGIVDGHDFAVDGSHALIYMYGPEAEAMFAVALPILQANEATENAQVRLRFGEAQNEHARAETRTVGSNRVIP